MLKRRQLAPPAARRQAKAAELALAHTLGIGAQQFAPYLQQEEPRNTDLFPDPQRRLAWRKSALPLSQQAVARISATPCAISMQAPEILRALYAACLLTLSKRQ